MVKIVKQEYDSRGNVIYREWSNGLREKFEYDKNGNRTYYKNSHGFWKRYKYDKNGNQIYYVDRDGFWEKRKYDNCGNIIYRENSNGFWVKREYNNNDNETYYENSDGFKKEIPKAEPKMPDLVDRNKVLETIFNVMSDNKIVHKHRALNRNIKQIPKVELKHELINAKPYAIFGIYRRDE